MYDVTDTGNNFSNTASNDEEVKRTEEEGFSVLDLLPETHYKLRMTAHNSAGSTVGVYGFTTLTHSGGATISTTELIIHSEYKLPGFLKLLVNPSIVLPVLLALIVIVSMMVFVVHQLKKDRFLLRGERHFYYTIDFYFAILILYEMFL